MSKLDFSGYLRQFVRQYGELTTVAVSTSLLVGLVVILAVATELALSRTVSLTSVYVSAVITVLVGPLILYSFVSLISRLDKSEAKLIALSIMDDLTDVYNRRHFLELAEKELAKAQRYGTIFTMLLLDVDNLKQTNEKYGQTAGDAVLQSLANTCMNNLRTMDIFARFGGGEFAYLIPESDKIDVVTFAKRVLDAVEDSVVVFDRNEIRYTVSIGIKSFDNVVLNMDSMLKEVNEALAEAKSRGGNCIVIYDVEERSSAEPALPA